MPLNATRKLFHFLLPSLALSLTLTGHAQAQNISVSLLDLANQGFAQSQRYVGELYLQGKDGMPKDEDMARYWFERAANQGNEQSMYYLGLIYERMPAESDKHQALNYYERAARAGLPHAQFRLAQMIFQGEFVERNDAAALEWFTLAADQGLAPAKYNLAMMYYKGMGVEPDEEAALEGFKRSCEAGFKRGCEASEELNQRLHHQKLSAQEDIKQGGADQ